MSHWEREPFTEHSMFSSVMCRPTMWGWTVRHYVKTYTGRMHLVQTKYVWTRWGARRVARRWTRE